LFLAKPVLSGSGSEPKPKKGKTEQGKEEEGLHLFVSLVLAKKFW
jgi:hypothetical protein